MGDGAMTKAVEAKLKEKLACEHCVVTDLSDGCGSKLDLFVVSDKFEGMKLLEMQRAVHQAIEEEMKSIHAVTMKTKTVKQWKEAGEGQ